MSSLLEQAIIDATALKEAALKNAEASVLEKYAPEVRRAVETLLEQPEDPMAMVDPMADPMAAAAPEMSADGIDADLAATEGEDMCGCPDEDESTELEIDFSELQNYVKGEEPEEDQEDLAASMPQLQEVEVSDTLIDAIINEVGSDCTDENEEEVVEEADESSETEEAETIDENELTDMVEKMVVDMAQKKTGWLGVSEGDAAHEAELELARRQSTEFQEENEALKKATAELQEKLSHYQGGLTELKNKLNETNLTNARLFYANRVLKSGSLNERQKDKVVNAISKAGSVKEAKVIYETLQNTVGTAPDRRGPQSLREAVTRPSSIMSLRENRNRHEADPVSERMQILAGIKK